MYKGDTDSERRTPINMPHIKELDTSEANKENVHPTYTRPFDLDNLVEHFDKQFKEFEDYRNFIQTHLTNWHYNTDFCLSTQPTASIASTTTMKTNSPPS